MPSSSAWFQSASIYHIYPRSFMDSNGDGIGDLPGITQKLDYLLGDHSTLRFDAIWLSPIYSSPMFDLGYDVKDHCAIDPIFGSMADFDVLLEEIHGRGGKLILDFVPNHTSLEHNWFIESRQSKSSLKRDWYIWRDGTVDGGPPNNWLSVFGGSAWTHDPVTNQFYLHSFLSQQPDLNWRNPEVRNAMMRVARFWLDKGVDGLRVDAVYWLAKDPLFRDDPVNHAYRPGDDPYSKQTPLHSTKYPEIFAHLRQLADTVATYPDRCLITEAYPSRNDGIEPYMEFYYRIPHAFTAPFNFEILALPWNAQQFKQSIDGFQAALPNNRVAVYNFGNHDHSRLASRYGQLAARAAAVLLACLPGTRVFYYGDELGMRNAPGVGSNPYDEDSVVSNYPAVSRNRVRSPMPWSTEHGFSDSEPWLPIHHPPEGTVAEQINHPNSIMSLYKQLLQLRQANPIIKHGTYRALDTPEDIFGYQLVLDQSVVTVLINFSTNQIQLPQITDYGQVLLSTHVRHPENRTATTVHPNEAMIFQHQ